LSEIGDAFLDMRGWGKGIVFVNGHNLGRYWYIGPQQTLYLPGVWLKKGVNEIVVFEQIKDDVGALAGIKEPILNQLNKDGNATTRGKMKEPKLQASDLVQEGQFSDSPSAQNITFPAKKARWICLQALSSHNGDEYTTIAELDVLDAAGASLPHKDWKIAYVDSEENFAEDNAAEKAIDGDPDSFWHTLWSAPHTSHPHEIVVDLGAEHQITAVRVLPRQDTDHGRIKDYRLYLISGQY
jgi:beta-galactosidase